MIARHLELSYTYQQLDSSLGNALRLPFRPNVDKFIIFSDLHMADRVRWVDDFERNEIIYCHALQHYYDQGYRLILNGDIEECWEAKPRQIINAYRDTTYAAERLFAEKGHDWHVRIYGNHDDLWSKPEKVKKHLWPVLGPVTVHPAVHIGEDIFITHGHQGDIAADSYSWLSRYFVRHPWRWLQKLMRLSTSRAAVNQFIRKRRDELLYSWAKDNRKLLIAGHTHRNMFRSYSTADKLQFLLQKLETNAQQSHNPHVAKATANYLKRHIGSNGFHRKPVEQNPVPCYFNAGTCVYTDGITGMELVNGEIRLIKWEIAEAHLPMTEAAYDEADFELKIDKKILQRAKLETVLNRVKSGTQISILTGQEQIKVQPVYEGAPVERVA